MNAQKRKIDDTEDNEYDDEPLFDDDAIDGLFDETDIDTVLVDLGADEFPVNQPAPAEGSRFDYEYTFLYASPQQLTQVRLSLPRIDLGGVEVRSSRIPGASLGLFATRSFAAREFITEYDGKRITTREAKQASVADQSHMRSLQPNTTVIEGLRVPEPGRGGASFANDTINFDASTPSQIVRDDAAINAAFAKLRIKTQEPEFGVVAYDRIAIVLMATRPIAAGEEIYINYGSDYWTTVLIDSVQ